MKTQLPSKLFKSSHVFGFTMAFLLGLGIIFNISTGQANMFGKDREGRKIIRPINERFESLQAYLDWTNNTRMMDIPKYKEVSKGYYKYQRTRGQARDDTLYSYEDLKKKLGFSK